MVLVSGFSTQIQGDQLREFLASRVLGGGFRGGIGSASVEAGPGALFELCRSIPRTKHLSAFA